MTHLNVHALLALVMQSMHREVKDIVYTSAWCSVDPCEHGVWLMHFVMVFGKGTDLDHGVITVWVGM